MALATALAVVAACGSDADKSDAPAAASSHSAHAGGSSAPPLPLRAGERFVDLKMAEAYTPAPPEGGGTDECRCQVIDPGLTKAVFLTGTQLMPENVAIAHHAIVYAVPPGGAQQRSAGAQQIRVRGDVDPTGQLSGQGQHRASAGRCWAPGLR
jgi:hypothetical protein